MASRFAAFALVAVAAGIPNVTLPTRMDAPLLAVGLGANLPSACGGKGTCGTCKCVVAAGGGDVLPTELSHLSSNHSSSTSFDIFES